jgi:hypothetical protein
MPNATLSSPPALAACLCQDRMRRKHPAGSKGHPTMLTLTIEAVSYGLDTRWDVECHGDCGHTEPSMVAHALSYEDACELVLVHVESRHSDEPIWSVEGGLLGQLSFELATKGGA